MSMGPQWVPLWMARSPRAMSASNQSSQTTGTRGLDSRPSSTRGMQLCPHNRGRMWRILEDDVSPRWVFPKAETTPRQAHSPRQRYVSSCGCGSESPRMTNNYRARFQDAGRIQGIRSSPKGVSAI